MSYNNLVSIFFFDIFSNLHDDLEAKVSDFIKDRKGLLPYFLIHMYPNLVILDDVCVPLDQTLDKRWLHTNSSSLKLI